MSSFDELASRIFPNMKSGAAPAPFRVADQPAAPAPIGQARTLDELAASSHIKDKTPTPPPAVVLMPGSMEERASRMQYQSNLPDLGDDDQPDAPVLAPVPDAVQELRDADGARRMYSPQVTYALALPDDLITDGNTPEPVRAAVVSEMREIAADVGASAQEVIKLRSVAAGIKETPSPAQRNAWHTEAVDRLNAEFGETAAQALRDAAKLVQRDPRLTNILNINGLGDHPDTILMMARLARQARLANKLK